MASMAVGIILEAQQAEAVLERTGRPTSSRSAGNRSSIPISRSAWATPISASTVKFEDWTFPNSGWWLEKRIQKPWRGLRPRPGSSSDRHKIVDVDGVKPSRATPAARSFQPVPSAKPAAARRCAGSLQPRRARRAARRFRIRRRAPARTGTRRQTDRRRRWYRRSFGSGNAGTATTPNPPEATTQPFSPRVTTPSLASSRNCASALSKSAVWYSEVNSASLAKIRSTVPFRIKSRNSPR